MEAYVRHDPLNPTAILACERHGVPFAEMCSEKFVSRENAVRIDDLSGSAVYCGKKGFRGEKKLPLGYAGMESTVPVFQDHPLATHARPRVTNYMGFEATQEREVLAVVPIQGSAEQQWISLSDLVSTEWDEKSDPTGLMRQARRQFQAARAAYLRNSAPDFNRASAAFRRAVGQLGIGNITLGYFLAGSEDQPTIRSLTGSTYRTLQVGVLLLAVGTVLGAVWADYSWGRFWGWDPKEVWALVVLLAYVAVLHARSAGWVREFGLAALSVMCFSLVLMAWYGVNFVLGSGLHSYGFGGGGQMYVFSAIAVQGLYVTTAGIRYVVSGASAEARRAADGRAQG